MSPRDAPPRAPGFWMNETSGVLRPAVTAYLNHEPMTGEQIAAMRAYFRQWIAPGWMYGDPALEPLRAKIDGLTSIAALDAWLEEAIDLGIDPL